MRKELLACSAAIISIFGHGQTPASEQGSAAVKELAPARLAEMIKAPSIFVYDGNEEDMYAEAHVPGAKLMVYDQVTADKLPSDHGATLVFYCYSPECPAGASAAHTAVLLGFTDVHCMIAGITGWQDAGFPTEP